MRLRTLTILLGLAALLAPAHALALPSAGTNAKIVYTSDGVGGNADVFVANPDGSGARNLTSNAAQDVDPAVSPDGTRIVLASNRSGAYNLFVINVDGTGSPIRLTASPFNQRHPAWSADGNTIFFSQDNGDATKKYDLWKVDASGLNPQSVASNDGDDIDPAYAPDSSWLIWASAGAIFQTVATSPAAGTQRVFPASGQLSPTWAPDSSRFAYIDGTSGTIVVQSADGASLVDTGVAAGQRVVWSPDGSRLLFDDGASGLYTMNPDGTGVTQVTSNANDVAADWVPGIANVRVPQVSGSLTLGSTLVADAGVWTGATSFTYSYQWKRCNPPGGSGCLAITGATGPTYTTTVSDLNAALRVYVTAASSAGTAVAASAAVTGLTNPVSTTLPTISGSTDTGSTLTATTGSVGSGLGSAALTYAFQWERCDTLGDQCSAITGATAPTYVIGAADSGHTIRVVVTATNTSGSATGTSLATGVVGGLQPVNTIIPVVAGQPIIGAVLVATSGTWTGGAGITFTYQWKRCSAGGDNCLPITDATGTSYTVVADDSGSTLEVTVTAANSHGIVAASSIPTGIAGASPSPAGPGAPGATVHPGVVGVAVIGGTLTATTGGFVGANLTYAYQWQRCDTSATHCDSIQGATKATYVVRQPDLGSTLRVVVTARNGLGSASDYSDTTPAVTAAPAASTTLTTQAKRKTKRLHTLVPKRGQKRVVATRTTDVIRAADGRREIVDCAGHAVAYVDQKDVVVRCKVVHRTKRTGARRRS